MSGEMVALIVSALQVDVTALQVDVTALQADATDMKISIARLEGPPHPPLILAR